MTTLDTEVLVIGSGAGGAVTAATLARAGRTVTILEEGPWVDPDATEPFSLEEMVAKYRHGGSCAALGRPGDRVRRRSLRRREHRDQQRPLPPAAGRARRGMATRVPHRRVRRRRARPLRGTHRRGAGRVAPSGRAADVVGRAGARRREARLAGGRVLTGVPLRAERPRGEADDGAHPAPARDRRPAPRVIADCRVVEAVAAAATASSARRANARVPTARPSSSWSAPTTCSCARARPRRPRLLQRSGIRRNIGNGLKMHPTVKIAARFDHPIDHGDVPMHRVTEFAPGFTIGGSASRRGHVALALADSGADYADALADWERVAVYYAAIRSEGRGRVRGAPGPLRAARHLQPHRRRHEPARTGTPAPGRGAPRGGRHRAVPVGHRRRRRARHRRPRAVVGRDLAQPGQPDDGAPHVDGPHRREPRAHRRRQLRPGLGLHEPARERRVVAPRRARRQPAGHDHGDRAPGTATISWPSSA